MHDLPCQPADLSSILPCSLLFNRVPVQRLRICQRESRDGLSGAVLNFDAEAPRRRGRVIQQQLFPGEGHRPCRRLTTGQRRMERNEAVETNRVAPQAMLCVSPRAFIEVERDLTGQTGFVRFRLEQPIALVVVAVNPAAFPLWPRTEECLVPPSKGYPVATRHE